MDGDVLVGRGDDLVAALERQAVDDDVDAFGGAADEAEVLAAAGRAEGPGQLVLDLLPGFLVVTGARGALFGPEEADQGVDDGQRRGAEAAEVEEDPVGVEEELGAKELPGSEGAARRKRRRRKRRPGPGERRRARAGRERRRGKQRRQRRKRRGPGGGRGAGRRLRRRPVRRSS
ncbi:MAG: hypothetical protein MUE80_05035 [Acidobacteria bacterium]|nr:hypothetical protein [Acidobacteriota bacterium]